MWQSAARVSCMHSFRGETNRDKSNCNRALSRRDLAIPRCATERTRATENCHVPPPSPPGTARVSREWRYFARFALPGSGYRDERSLALRDILDGKASLAVIFAVSRSRAASIWCCDRVSIRAVRWLRPRPVASGTSKVSVRRTRFSVFFSR